MIKNLKINNKSNIKKIVNYVIRNNICAFFILNLTLLLFLNLVIYKSMHFISYNYEQFKVGKLMLKVIYIFEILYPCLIYK